MSKTEFKNAGRVWGALVQLSADNGQDFYVRQWWAVGEIAKKANVSRPTVKKYLDMAVEQGRALSVFFGGRWEFRCLPDGE